MKLSSYHTHLPGQKKRRPIVVRRVISAREIFQHFLLIIFALLVRAGQCQNAAIVDSLNAVIASSSGKIKYVALRDLALLYVDLDNEKALAIANEAKVAAFSTRDTLLMTKSQILRGQILYRMGRPQEAISSVQPFLSYQQVKASGREYMVSTNLIGVCYLVIGQFDQSLEYCFRTYERAKEVNDTVYLAISLKNIGVSYYKLKDYGKALNFMLDSDAIEQSIGIDNFSTPLNISLCYAHLGDFNRAALYLQRSINVCGDDCLPAVMVHHYYARGYIEFGLENFPEAESLFLKSLEYAKAAKDFRMQMDNLYLLGKMAIKEGNFDKAKAFLNQGERLIDEGIPFNMEMIKIYRELSELHLGARDFERAAFYQSRYIALRDSIYNESLTTSLMTIESAHLQRQNVARITAQSEIIALKEEVINRQSNLNIVTSLLAVTAFAFLIFLFKSYLFKKRVNLRLEETVRRRTRELDERVSKLRTSVRVSELHLQKLSRTASETSRLIQNLCEAGVKEACSEDISLYLKRISETALRLECLQNHD